MNVSTLCIVFDAESDKQSLLPYRTSILRNRYFPFLHIFGGYIFLKFDKKSDFDIF